MRSGRTLVINDKLFLKPAKFKPSTVAKRNFSHLFDLKPDVKKAETDAIIAALRFK